ncbi:MAG: GntR family transcriptional regulator [Gemmataceae bacterium]|nr:GntR family transcriptional regulator [Gemmataceae bacterium]MDW8266649.1 GntR family transcriptional regulator [Gemmataceae bacterium]
MATSRRRGRWTTDSEQTRFSRLERPPSLTARVEQLLREAISRGEFADGRLPTEMELAEQLGVSRETVRLAAEALQRDGLLVKIRRIGTFLRAPTLPERIERTPSTVLGYLQAGYQASRGQEEEAVTRLVSGLMLQGALEEAGRAGFRLIVQHTMQTQVSQVFRALHRDYRLRGVIFSSYGEEKLLRRVAGLGLPTVLLDHDLYLPGVHSVRDDSFQGARDAVRFLAELGHRRIGFINWRQTELNPWRLRGYRQGLRELGLPRRRAWELAVEVTKVGASQAVDQFLCLEPRPTALYCFNNSLAKLVIEELDRRGLKVPGDVSIVGGGGEEAAGLTCHQADWFDMGRTAVQLLVRASADRAPQISQHIVAPHVLRPGLTTAPVCSTGQREREPPTV